jgi:disulfide bond formation protein DsbB
MYDNRRLGADRRQPVRFSLSNRVTRGALAGLIVSGGLLAGAYGFQHLGGLLPCEMCLWQRIPHWVILFASLAVLALQRLDKALRARVLLALCGLAALASMGLGLWHVGVEQKWWPSPVSCSLGQGEPDFLSMRVAFCDEPQWQLFTVSMAGYNMLISLALAIFIVLHVRKKR